MSKFKPVLDGIKNNLSKNSLQVPHFEKVNPEHSSPEDVQQVLNELRNLKQLYENTSPMLNLQNIHLKVEVLGKAIEDIENLPGYNFE